MAVKEYLASSPTLSYFDHTRPTRLCTDASHQGLGFVLQQRSDEAWVLIQASSRFLSDTESRYAIIGLEMLAVLWAIMKCRLFVAGLEHFEVITDHHPLVPILNKHHLDEIENPRLQRLKTRLMGYNFTAKWIKGALSSAPDALSRNPVSDPLPSESITCAQVRAVHNAEGDSPRMNELCQHAAADCEYQQLLHYVCQGFGSLSIVASSLKSAVGTGAFVTSYC